MKKSYEINAHLALFLVSSIYGFFYIALKLLLIELSPMLILWLRLTLSACIVLPIEFMVFKSRFTKADFIKCAIIGLLGVYCVHFSLILGAGKTSSFYAALIMASVPLITLLFSLTIKKEQMQWQRITGVSLGFLGVASILAQQSLNLPQLTSHYANMGEGNLWILAAAVCFSIFLLQSDSLLQRYRAFSVMAYSYVISAIAFSATILLIPNLIPKLDFQKLQHATTNTWLLVGFLVIGASIMTYTLNNYALKRTSPNVVAIYMFLAPIQAALWGYFILGEPFSWQMAAAAILTFGGILLANQAPSSEKLVKEAYSESITDEVKESVSSRH